MTIRLAVIAVLGLVGCFDRRPAGLIVCHNANCATGTDPFQDANLASLDRSLALKYRDRPAADGMELDTVWDAAGGRCLFAHDFEHQTGALGSEAADRVAAYLAQPTDFVSWDGSNYFVKIELKDTVSAAGARHTPEELVKHYDCVFDMYARITAAAVANRRDLVIAFESTVTLVRGLPSHPMWPGKEPLVGVHVRLIANVESPGLQPEDLASLRGDSSRDGLDILSFHASRIPDALQQAYLALDVQVMIWMLDTALETFDVIQAFEPNYIDTNEAVLLRRWLED